MICPNKAAYEYVPPKRKYSKPIKENNSDKEYDKKADSLHSTKSSKICDVHDLVSSNKDTNDSSSQDSNQLLHHNDAKHYLAKVIASLNIKCDNKSSIETTSKSKEFSNTTLNKSITEDVDLSTHNVIKDVILRKINFCLKRQHLL